MRATVKNSDTDDDALRAYCQKHSRKKYPFSDSEEESSSVNVSKAPEEMLSSEKRANIRQQKIHEKEAEFFNYVNIDEVAELFQYDRTEIEIIYNYWKLKRVANWNRALLPPKLDTESNCTEEDSPFAFLKKLVHHRQDLERARNLCYMVIKREKSTKQWINIKASIFEKQCEILSKGAEKLSAEEIEAVQSANFGDLAYDKKYTGENGPSPNMVSVLTNLVGENICKSQLNGAVKVSRKNERIKSENPYAKFYLNGVAKRSQRFFQVDKSKKVCPLQNNSFVEDKSNVGFSFLGSSDPLASDDGFDTLKDIDDNHPSGFMSDVEMKYESESTCDDLCISDLNSPIEKETLNNDPIKTEEIQAGSNIELCFSPICSSPPSKVTDVSSSEDILKSSGEAMSCEPSAETLTLDCKTISFDVSKSNESPTNSKSTKTIYRRAKCKVNNKVNAKLKKEEKSSEMQNKVSEEESIILKEDISVTQNVTGKDSNSLSNESKSIKIVQNQNITSMSPPDIKNVSTDKWSSDSKSLEKKIKVEEDAKLNSPVCVLVKPDLPLSALQTGRLKIEPQPTEDIKNSSVKSEGFECNNSNNNAYKKVSLKDSILQKNKMDPKVCLIPLKSPPVGTLTSTHLNISENGVNTLSPKHNQNQYPSKLTCKSKPKNISSSHLTSPLSVNKQHPSSPSTKCQDKSPLYKFDDSDSSEQRLTVESKEKPPESQLLKKDTLRGYKIPKKSRTNPEGNSLDLKRGSSPLSPLPDFTSSSLSSYQAKSKPCSWRKLEPRTNNINAHNSRTNLNGDVHHQQSERLVLKLKKDTTDPESQRWQSDPGVFVPGGMPGGWGDFPPMPPPLIHPPYPPVRHQWSRMEHRSGFRGVPMNFHNVPYT